MPTEPTIIFDKRIGFERRDNASYLNCLIELSIRKTTSEASAAAKTSRAEIKLWLLRDREGGESAADTRQRIVNRAKVRFQDYIDVREDNPGKFDVHWEVPNDGSKRYCKIDSRDDYGEMIFPEDRMKVDFWQDVESGDDADQVRRRTLNFMVTLLEEAIAGL